MQVMPLSAYSLPMTWLADRAGFRVRVRVRASVRVSVRDRVRVRVRVS